MHMSKNSTKSSENIDFTKNLDQEVFEKMAGNSNQKPMEVDIDEDGSKDSHMYYSPKDIALKFCGKLITDNDSDITSFLFCSNNK